jgi:hypothetical protein
MRFDQIVNERKRLWRLISLWWYFDNSWQSCCHRKRIFNIHYNYNFVFKCEKSSKSICIWTFELWVCWSFCQNSIIFPLILLSNNVFTRLLYLCRLYRFLNAALSLDHCVDHLQTQRKFIQFGFFQDLACTRICWYRINDERISAHRFTYLWLFSFAIRIECIICCGDVRSIVRKTSLYCTNINQSNVGN